MLQGLQTPAAIREVAESRPQQAVGDDADQKESSSGSDDDAEFEVCSQMLHPSSNC